MSPQQWFVFRGGKEEGPYTATQLKAMAASGAVKPTDQVRRGDAQTLRPASAVKGLFAEALPTTPSLPPASGPSAEVPAEALTKNRLLKYGVIGGGAFLAMILVCAGIGALVGKKPGGARDSLGDRKSSSGVVGTTELPDFSKVDYSHDFSADDYKTIPAGAKRHTHKQEIDDGSPSFMGKPKTDEGYIDASGKFVPHGKFVIWADESQTKKLREGLMLHGQVHGVMTDFIPSGKVKVTMPFVHDKRHGVAKTWHENGQLSAEEYYFEGKQHGVSKGWHQNGKPEFEGTWVDGKRHGPYRSWFKSGKPSRETHYRDGVLHGPFVSYSDDFSGFSGVVESAELDRGVYENGKPTGVWRFGFVSDTHKVYHVEADAGRWQGGTTEEIIAKMKYFMMERNPSVTMQFDPRAGIANCFADSPEDFIAVFGRPTSDTQDAEKAGAPAPLRARYRKWRYDLKNGSLHFRVQPTQDGKIFITTRR
jgi:antitoxin component YwqK of YwqJK toxin-antitoxin module